MTELGQLIDKYTVRYERNYPHPVQRVWKALTTGSSMDAWMMPDNEIDARLGGTFVMSFAQEDPFTGKISAFKEDELVQYDFDNGEMMRFEIEPSSDGTKLVFTHVIVESVINEMAPPGGEDIPWQPGLMTGWHLMFDTLGGFLDGDPAVTAEAVVQRNLDLQAAFDGNSDSPAALEMRELTERYAKALGVTLPA